MRWAAHRTLQQPADAVLQHRVGGQPEGVFVAFHFQRFVDLGFGEGGITAEVAALHLAPVTRDHRFEQIAPTVGTVHIAGPQCAALKIAELVEHEQRVVAHAGKMTIVGAALLGAVGLADTAVHVEHDSGLRLAREDPVDPRTGQISQCCEVGLAGQPSGLEAAHLTRRSSATVQPAAIHHGAHCRIVCQAIGIVHVFIAGEAAEHGLAQ